MRTTTKLLSVILSICMVISVAVVGVVPAAADTTSSSQDLAQETIQGSAVLHCFNWSYNNIKAALPDIAAAGYTAVQTSPVQRPKDYNSSWTDTGNQWWKLYQPLGLSIAADNTSWLGTKTQLASLCNEAETYGIKVIVDIVANHLANGGTDGGTYDYLNSDVDNSLKNRDYYHTNNTRTSDDSRYTITQYHLGMPDLNTGNSNVQQAALGLLKECIDCGVDGFRFDAAKHIETPTDDSSYASQFWPTVINGAKSYAQTKGVAEPFFYGEILGNAGPNFGVSNYTTYMAVTDNYTGDRALDKTFWQWAPELADGTYYKGASADKSVLWVESHDTYMGSSGSAYFTNTNQSDVTSTVINRAWAWVASRADSTALFFARPNSVMGAASTDTNWKSKVVTEVNKFKNHFNGTGEYISYSGDKIAYNERGDSGVVIVKLDGSGSVNIPANAMASGTYTDQITGNTFTVSNGTISGNVGDTGVAVVYNADSSAVTTITAPTLYLQTGADNWPHNTYYAMYVFNNNTGNAWVNMTDSDNDGIYEADVPIGNWTGVVFCKMKNSAVGWDNKDYQTIDLLPTGDENLFTVTGTGTNTNNYTGTWSSYSSQTTTAAPTTVAPTTVAPTTVAPTTVAPTAEPTTAPANTYTIYAINNAEWSNVYVYWWGSSTACSWPGNEMTSYSGTKVYTYNIPNDATGLIFNIGSNSKQTVDITSGINDGAVFTINSTQSNGKYTYSAAPDYYLVGTMNSWSNNNNYKFSISANSDGKLEYKLSGVQLAANAEFKVHSSSDSWYPSGSNHTVDAAGTYDIYFRPNGDGGSSWLVDSSNSSKRYVYPANVTPYTVTWKDGDGNTLKTETVTHGTTPSYTGETPTKTATEQYSYSFNNTWSPTPAAVTGDTIYTAQFDSTVRTYTVTWKNYDGTTLETDTNVPYGSAPSYDGDTPTRPNNGATIYTFSGWSPEITNETTVTGDVTYTAMFTAATQTYTITWKDGDGNTLKTETCIQGVTPQYTGDEPTKTATAQYSYTFNDTWDPPLAAASADTTYTAQFDSTVNKYTITWKDGNGATLKTEQVEYGLTPSYTGTTPTKDADANYYTFNETWSPAITSVTQNATYTAQFDATPIPSYTIYATNVIDWDDVYVYYWTDFVDNDWPGQKMTADDDNFIMSAEIPENAIGIIFTNGAQGNTLQTADITTGIKEGAHWAILNENDEDEPSKYKVHAVPSYYLVGSMTNWSTTNAATFTPFKNDSKVEEYKLSGAELSKNDQIKVYSSNDIWYPDGYENQYDVTVNGTYDIYFRPNGDGGSDWHESYFYVNNVTPYTITWKDGNGETLKTDTVIHGDTPAYTGDTPTKTATAQYTYTFNNTWSPSITAATADATYTAQFTETVNKYTVTWMCDGTVLGTEDVAYGETPSYTGTTPTRNATAQYTYTFSGWDPAVNTVTGNVTYTAQFTETVNEYTIRFVNENGTELQSSQVAYGETPVYNGATPTKDATAQYTYTFNGWDYEITSVTGDKTYTATYTSVVNVYSVTWKNYNGDTIKTDYYEYGETPEYTDDAPARQSTAEYSYEFTGWDPEIQEVTQNAEYTAVFRETTNTYTVSWLNYNGDELETDENVPYGTAPDYNGETPNRPADAQYTYVFIGWSPSINVVTGNAAYTAQYTMITNTYTVTWNNYNGTELTHRSWTYGSTPSYSGDTPTKPADGQHHYIFSGWTPAVTAVTGNVTYTAEFAEHDLYHQEAIPATCEHAGVTEYWACNTCGRYYADEACTNEHDLAYFTISQLDHNIIHNDAVPATCETAGNIEYWYCTSCQSCFNNSDCADEHKITLADTVIPATGHTPMISYAANEATCTAAGNSAYYECGTCHKYFSDITAENEIAENSWVIPANGHSWDFENGTWYWYGLDNYDVSDPYEYNMVAAEMEVDCVSGDSTTQLQADVILETYHEPTCTSAGVAQFKATLHDYPQYETFSEEIVIPALPHSYGEPEWTWGDDNTTATATFTCAACNDPQEVEADVELSYSEGKEIYTATVTFNSTEYTDTKTVDREGLVAGHSLTIGSDIGTNFFLNPTPEELEQGITVSFEWFDKTTEPVTPVYDSDKHLYRVTCDVAAAEMTYEITATIRIGDSETVVDLFSPVDYANYVLTDAEYIAWLKDNYGEDTYDKVSDLCLAMLDYGARAQIRFDRDTDNLANGGEYTYDNSELTWDSDASDMTANLDDYGLTYVGSTVIYLSKTALRHYYKITDASLFAQFAEGVTMDGSPIEYGERNGMIYFEVPEIFTYELDVQHDLTIGSNTYSYSATDYLAKLVATSSSQTAIELAKATYRYHLKAKALFG